MMGAKLAFFVSISSLLEPFLKEFQCDAPMAPFLHKELTIMLSTVMNKFVKPEIMANNSSSLAEIDLFKKADLIEPKKVALGHLTRVTLRKSTFSDKEILPFRQNCRLY